MVAVDSADFLKTHAGLVQRRSRRRWTAPEKLAILAQTVEGGNSVSSVARRHGIAISLLFEWRKQERLGTLTDPADGAGVPVAELVAARAEIARLERILMSAENENRALRQAMQSA